MNSSPLNRTTSFRPDQAHPSAFIAPGAVVVGDVTLEEQVSVWFTAVLRGDTEPITVGAGSNIQDGAVLHADPGFPCRIGPGVTVGHRAIVHGAVVEAGALIGMGAIVLNGAHIGAGSLIGAGALVPPGVSIPPGMLAVGLPVRVLRPLTAEESASLSVTAQSYVTRAALYRDSTTPST